MNSRLRREIADQAAQFAGIRHAVAITSYRPSITAITRAYGNLPSIALADACEVGGRHDEQIPQRPVTLALDAVADRT
jgi:hypothetical protein